VLTAVETRVWHVPGGTSTRFIIFANDSAQCSTGATDSGPDRESHATQAHSGTERFAQAHRARAAEHAAHQPPPHLRTSQLTPRTAVACALCDGGSGYEPVLSKQSISNAHAHNTKSSLFCASRHRVGYNDACRAQLAEVACASCPSACRWSCLGPIKSMGTILGTIHPVVLHGTARSRAHKSVAIKSRPPPFLAIAWQRLTLVESH